MQIYRQTDRNRNTKHTPTGSKINKQTDGDRDSETGKETQTQTEWHRNK